MFKIPKISIKIWSLVLVQGLNCYQWENRIIPGILIIVVMFLTNSCGGGFATRHIEGSAMGTFYTVTYRADIDSDELKPILNKHLSDIEAQLSNWDDESWISRFNNSRDTSFAPIPMHAYKVVKAALVLARKTDRALDPTLGSLINLWGFGPAKADHPPDRQTIRNALKATGPEKLSLRDAPARFAKTDPDLQLNVSSIAKGYAADVLACALEKDGITDYIVNIGGEMRISGHPEDRSSWKVAIQKPDPDARDGQAHVTIQLSRAGLATSGDYRRYLEIGGQCYPHILDPQTGRPVQTDLVSATIIASTSMQADGLATACLVLGLQKAQEVIAGMPGAEGLFIQRDKNNQYHTYTTPGWPDAKLQGGKPKMEEPI